MLEYGELLKFLSFRLAEFALNCNMYIEVDDLLPVIDYYEQVKLKPWIYVPEL